MQVLPERAVAAPHPLGDEQVLARRHLGEQLDALERAPDAEPGPAVRRHAGEVVPVEAHGAAIGLQHAEQAVEERGLPGAVRADEADDLARFDIEAHLIERGDARERLGDLGRLEQAHGVAPAGRDLATCPPLLELVDARLDLDERLAGVELEQALPDASRR